MKYLQLLNIVVILLIFLSSCSTLQLFKKSTPKKRISITPTAHAAPTIHIAPVIHTAPVIPDTEKLAVPVEKPQVTGLIIPENENSIKKHTAEFIAVAALLWILLFYRLQKAKFQRKKHFKLDDDDMALLGLAVDTLGDLWRRLQVKTKCKIIPFLRRE